MIDAKTPPRGTLATLSLTWVGGFVDGVCFLALYGMFVTFMSGNTTIMGVNAVRASAYTSWYGPLPVSAFPLAVFVLGGTLAGVFLELRGAPGAERAVAMVLLAEAALLAAFAACGQGAMQDGSLRPESIWQFYALSTLPAVAMGMQNVALRRTSDLRDGKTFVTGTLTGLSESAASWIATLVREPREAGAVRRWRDSLRTDQFRKTAWLAIVWSSFVIGAFCGALAKSQWELYSLAAPTAVLVACALPKATRSRPTIAPDRAV